MAKSKKSPVKTNPYAKMYSQMEKKLAKCYENLRQDMLKHASLETLKNDTHELMLLLGETNYLAKECRKLQNRES
jgi:hypothetical protein